jgi:hypothetical protein
MNLILRGDYHSFLAHAVSPTMMVLLPVINDELVSSCLGCSRLFQKNKSWFHPSVLFPVLADGGSVLRVLRLHDDVGPASHQQMWFLSSAWACHGCSAEVEDVGAQSLFFPASYT